MGNRELTPVVKILLIINLSLFIAQILPGIGPFVNSQLALVPYDVIRGRVWQLLSYGFLHDTSSFSHIFFNMLGLWIFGCSLERYLGAKKFIQLYLFSILIGGFLSLFYLLGAGNTHIVGASAGLLGLLTIYGILFPDNKILLFMVLPVNARLLVILYAIFTFGSAVVGAQDSIAHWSHLGGIVAAFIYYKLWLNRTAPIKAKRAKKKDTAVHYYEPRKSRQEIAQENDDIDAVLKKISREGMDSLTDNEYKILEKASGKSVKRK